MIDATKPGEDLDAKHQATPNLWTEAGARFCPRRVYRFTLWRKWGDGDRLVLWIMLNPSTADEHVLDPTIRRCRGYSEAWGYDGLVVCNLFALRATNPRVLYHAADPGCGTENLDAILAEAAKATLIVAAWGNHGRILGQVGDRVRRMLVNDGRQLHHLGLTNLGQPKHPLYQPKNATLVPWA